MLDSPQIQGAVRKAMAAIVGFLLIVVLLAALLLSGFYLLGKAATIAMVPLIGEAGALAVTGFACLLILALIFYRLSRRTPGTRSDADKTSRAGHAPIAVLRDLIRNNPLESAIVAFAFGVAENTDPRLKSLLLEGSMVLMREQQGGAQSDEAEGAAPPRDEGSDS